MYVHASYIQTDQYHSQLLHQQCPSSHTCPCNDVFAYHDEIKKRKQQSSPTTMHARWCLLDSCSLSVQIHHTYLLLFIPIYYYSSHCNCWLAKKKKIINNFIVALSGQQGLAIILYYFVLLIKIIFLTIISFYLILLLFFSFYFARNANAMMLLNHLKNRFCGWWIISHQPLVLL